MDHTADYIISEVENRAKQLDVTYSSLTLDRNWKSLACHTSAHSTLKELSNYPPSDGKVNTHLKIKYHLGVQQSTSNHTTFLQAKITIQATCHLELIC
jgi:hypothetical protein